LGGELVRFERGCRYEGGLWRELYSDGDAMMLVLFWQPLLLRRRLVRFEFVLRLERVIGWSRGGGLYHNAINDEGRNNPTPLVGRDLGPIPRGFADAFAGKAASLDRQTREFIASVLSGAGGRRAG
jgi:hypothetical protein